MLRGLLLILIAIVLVVAAVKIGGGSSGVDESSPPELGLATSAHPGKSKPAEPARIPPRVALGQMIVARFGGANPSPAFLARIEKGEIGGVILFEENLRGGEVAIGRRVGRLQDAARAGDMPSLLVMVDQEGGTVKRIPGPPRRSAAAMNDADEAHEQGEATGYLLRRLGVNVDLAPVAGAAHRGSFLGSRTFASSPDTVADLACAFASGLREEGVAATLKHFPGLGLATANTDETAVTIGASPTEVRADYAPYEACADEPLTLVMVNSAIYPALTGGQPAVMSPRIYTRELPTAGAAAAVTISDDLETPAIQAQTRPGRRSINAGLDLLLYARTEATSAEAFDRLLEDVHTGAIAPAKVQQAATAILALKEQLAS